MITTITALRVKHKTTLSVQEMMQLKTTQNLVNYEMSSSTFWFHWLKAVEGKA